MRACLLLTTCLALRLSSAAAEGIPKTWDEAALAAMQTALLDASRTPRHMSEAAYRRIPELTIYKTYPVYAPGCEPAGYLDRLRQLQPEVIQHPTGEDVFDAPNFFEELDRSLTTPRALAAAGAPATTDGIYPFLRYVVRQKGRVELGGNACGTCHTRVMPDGSVIKGAQGNFPVDRVLAVSLRALAGQPNAAVLLEQFLRPLLRNFYAAPWIRPDPYERVARLSLDELADAWSRVPAGVMTRDGSTFDARPQIPDLIGVRDRLYLNHTGTLRHRSIGDLMRYAAIAQGAELGASWGDFRLVPELPPFLLRYTDSQLHSLANYLYQLRPPRNPHRETAESRHGAQVFASAGCAGCHTAPLYTNNSLIAADVIGTDPELATRSRKATGFYKVPSLKGLWYRGPFGHGGESSTLEDWLDPARLSRAPGHRFGLVLDAADKSALIAFLKTL